MTIQEVAAEITAASGAVDCMYLTPRGYRDALDLHIACKKVLKKFRRQDRMKRKKQRGWA